MAIKNFASKCENEMRKWKQRKRRKKRMNLCRIEINGPKRKKHDEKKITKIINSTQKKRKKARWAMISGAQVYLHTDTLISTCDINTTWIFIYVSEYSVYVHWFCIFFMLRSLLHVSQYFSLALSVNYENKSGTEIYIIFGMLYMTVIKRTHRHISVIQRKLNENSPKIQSWQHWSFGIFVSVMCGLQNMFHSVTLKGIICPYNHTEWKNHPSWWILMLLIIKYTLGKFRFIKLIKVHSMEWNRLQQNQFWFSWKCSIRFCDLKHSGTCVQLFSLFFNLKRSHLVKFQAHSVRNNKLYEICLQAAKIPKWKCVQISPPLYANGNDMLILHQKQNTFTSCFKITDVFIPFHQRRIKYFVKRTDSPTLNCQCSFYVFARVETKL